MKLNREQALSIVEKRNAGMTNDEIAAELGISRTSVAYWVRRLRKEGYEIKRFARGGRKAMEL